MLRRSTKICRTAGHGASRPLVPVVGLGRRCPKGALQDGDKFPPRRSRRAIWLRASRSSSRSAQSQVGRSGGRGNMPYAASAFARSNSGSQVVRLHAGRVSMRASQALRCGCPARTRVSARLSRSWASPLVAPEPGETAFGDPPGRSRGFTKRPGPWPQAFRSAGRFGLCRPSSACLHPHIGFGA
jgi:hypothetical protein